MVLFNIVQLIKEAHYQSEGLSAALLWQITEHGPRSSLPTDSWRKGYNGDRFQDVLWRDTLNNCVLYRIGNIFTGSTASLWRQLTLNWTISRLPCQTYRGEVVFNHWQLSYTWQTGVTATDHRIAGMCTCRKNDTKQTVCFVLPKKKTKKQVTQTVFKSKINADQFY